MPDAHLAQQFDDPAQQREAAKLGMWVFLMSEILFFGGMFTAYITYRVDHPIAWVIASHHLDFWLGTTDTALLLISSLTMALAVHSAQKGSRWVTALFLTLTMILGLLFLGIKFFEYAKHYGEGLFPGFNFTYKGPYQREIFLFMSFYFTMTGWHAIHMIVGLGLLSGMLAMTLAGKFSKAWHNPIVITGLYWHFVDIVWIVIFTLVYLVQPQ